MADPRLSQDDVVRLVGGLADVVEAMWSGNEDAAEDCMGGLMDTSSPSSTHSGQYVARMMKVLEG
jgi:hypothetical protein